MSPVFWMPAVWTAVVGVVLLVLLVRSLVLRPARRFARARDALRRGLAPRAAALQALAAARPRHRGSDRERAPAPRPGRGPCAGVDCRLLGVVSGRTEPCPTSAAGSS